MLWQDIQDLKRMMSDLDAKLAAARADILGAIEYQAFSLGVALQAQLDRIEAAMNPPLPAVRFVFYELVDGEQKEITMAQQKVDVMKKYVVAPVDKFGNAAAVDGAPVWALDNPALGSLVVAADGMSADFTPAGPVGSLKLQCSADADLGAGVVPLAGELPIDLLPGDAVALNISAV